MPTIKDIAKEAGVAQGTVSNVLNGRGNVSSDKIILVEQACAKLGYTMNQRAKTLRQGSFACRGGIPTPNYPFRNDGGNCYVFVLYKRWPEHL